MNVSDYSNSDEMFPNASGVLYEASQDYQGAQNFSYSDYSERLA